MKALFGKTVDILSDLVGARSQRHEILASNVSNIDTPGYEPKDVDFQNLLGSMQGKAIQIGRAHV
jgi:flagellar basal-body rod protein FlgB